MEAGYEDPEMTDLGYTDLEFEAWMREESEMTEAKYQMECIEVAAMDLDVSDEG